MLKRTARTLSGILIFCGFLTGFALAETLTDAPVRRIVLFNSGVGYFEHQGSVKGNSSIELPFHANDISDVLKSLVTEDSKGGTVAAASYPSANTGDVGGLSVDLSDAPTLGELVHQLRGETLELKRKDNLLTGDVINVEIRRESEKDGTVNSEYVTLLTKTGIRSVRLSDAESLRFTNPRLNENLQKSLKRLVADREADRRSIKLLLDGEGERAVRVGYVIGTPVWKTTYRLILTGKDQATLQGWAIVDNTTEFDWKDAKLSLVSGNPISFTSDIYEPLYTRRPHVPLEVDGSPRPPQFAGRSKFGPARLNGGGLGGGLIGGGIGGGFGGGSGFGGGYGGEGAAAASEDNLFGDGIDPTASVAPEVSASRVSEFFKYEMKSPVSIARRQSATIPMLSIKVPVERLSIFRASTMKRHPLVGLRLKNNSSSFLVAGTISVLDDSTFAGDSRIGGLPSGDDRLLTYAVDSETEIRKSSQSESERITSVQLEGGRAKVTIERRKQHVYEIANSGDGAKSVLIEHRLRDKSWSVEKLPAPVETTDKFIRYRRDVAPGKVDSLTVTEIRKDSSKDKLSMMSFDRIDELIRSADGNVRQQLEKLLSMRKQVNSAGQELGALISAS